ncbi:MAG: SufD family Fe-S cluster assembly protein [Candidatus Micrarchaeia archaeon]
MRMGYFVGNAQYAAFKDHSVAIDIPPGVRASATLVILYSGDVHINVNNEGGLALTIISESREKEHNLCLYTDIGKSAICTTTLNFKGENLHTTLGAKMTAEEHSSLTLNNILSHKGNFAGKATFVSYEKSKVCANTLVRPFGPETSTEQFISVRHAGRDSQSVIDVAGVLHTGSHCNFTGEIYIPKSTNEVVGSMKGRFMVAPGASVKALPILKIHSRDSQASHGISVMNLGRQELDYMCSRGISPEDAVALAEEGLVLEMINKMASTIDNVLAYDTVLGRMHVKSEI